MTFIKVKTAVANDIAHALLEVVAGLTWHLSQTFKEIEVSSKLCANSFVALVFFIVLSSN